MTPESLKAAGWTSREGVGFTSQLGSLWINGNADERMLGFLMTPTHANDAGTLHGGALMTFADVCLGYKAWEASQRTPMVTAQLQLQFVSSAQVGDFIIGRPELVRRTRQLVFVRGLISVGEKVVASADGIWKILEPRTGKET